ncbi:MAG: hypothetical protein AVDCRST_MAG73-3004, partial [uncultured Thermomicrobiales bacterium]
DAQGAGGRRRRGRGGDRRLWRPDDVARLYRDRGARRRRRARALRHRPVGPGGARHRDAATERVRGLPADPRRLRGPDHDADRARLDLRQDPGARPRRRRLPLQTLRAVGAVRPPARPRPPFLRAPAGCRPRLRARRLLPRPRDPAGLRRRGGRPPDLDRVPAAGGARPPRRHDPFPPGPARPGLGRRLRPRHPLSEGLRSPPPPQTRRRCRAPALHPHRMGRRVPVRGGVL